MTGTQPAHSLLNNSICLVAYYFFKLGFYSHVFWVMTPCSDMVGYQCFVGPCCEESIPADRNRLGWEHF